MPDTIRSFIAIALTREAKAALARLQERLQRTPAGDVARWVRHEDIHLTLKFLGDIPASQVQPIAEALQGACAEHEAFEITLAGLGCFPHDRDPRVVWVGIEEGAGPLVGLQESIEAAMAALGHPPESRPFHPHLTLARVKRGVGRGEAAALGRTLQSIAVGDLARVPVQAVYLLRSDLRPSGPIYTPLAPAELKTTMNALGQRG